MKAIENHRIKIALFLCVFGALGCLAQDTAASTDEAKTADEISVSGGIGYNPIRNDNEEVPRDPFKSPFEIEEEEREQRKLNEANMDTESEQKLPYSIGELELRGIYYQANNGYRAIFRVGNEYKWWPAGTKFQDGDLVNITDGAVIFKQYSGGDDIQVRDVVRELHRGEE